jgi:hypothetical protein
MAPSAIPARARKLRERLLSPGKPGLMASTLGAFREIERERHAKRSCVDLKRGVMGRAPWCKNYTVSLALGVIYSVPTDPMLLLLPLTCAMTIAAAAGAVAYMLHILLCPICCCYLTQHTLPRNFA